MRGGQDHSSPTPPERVGPVVNKYVHEFYDKSARYDPLRGRYVIGLAVPGTARTVNKTMALRAFFNL